MRDEITAVKDDLLEAGINLYPNPGTDKLTIAIENKLQGLVSVQMLSAIGQVINQTVVEKTETRTAKTIDTSDIPPGIYLIVVQQQGQTVVKKWAKY